ncbi:DUF2845 domain-containing protein [Pseudorhodoferax sp.]|jgi:hypothetical protein|uniref:DUF2845 domain-containing protein n=1 Tax=Pseudorhodoferax sp. TaxID=1993553 RepID=UPI001B7574AF|nr:DUF2845 domain-containing protein [Pseudorhodoferax sp.]MBP8144263.1 DUF2845 domain-containing protein [Inhella sp.]
MTARAPAFALLLLAPGAALATTTSHMRCGNDLVGLGDAPATVLRKCGEPAHRDQFCKADPQPDPFSTPPAPPPASTPARRARGCDSVDAWTYNPGRGQFWTTLRFENGALVEIRYGDRVR